MWADVFDEVHGEMFACEVADLLIDEMGFDEEALVAAYGCGVADAEDGGLASISGAGGIEVARD